MKPTPLRLAFEAVLLAAIWGASFLFMRIGVGEFGAIVMMALRIGLAAVCLLPILCLRQGVGDMRGRFGALTVVGVLNSAIPFSLLTWATLSLTAGFTSILNATVPFWSAVIAFVWLGERLDRRRLAGLLIGVAGVVVLVWGRIEFKPGGDGWAIAAGLLATACYGFSANYTRQRLAGVNALTIATGAMLGASLVLAPLAVWLWPATMPSARAWLSVLVLGVAGTAFAYILYFRLIAGLGATRAMSVTFLIPAFGVIWGAAFLGESVTFGMVAGMVLIVLGTTLTTGMLARPSTSAPAATPGRTGDGPV